MDWTRLEVEAAVADYFHMLTLDLTGQQYNKSAHRRALQEKLNGRSDGSIELKHQNISAILIEFDCPWIPGYKPRFNYQAMLFDVVAERVVTDKRFNSAALESVERPAAPPLLTSAAELLEPAPERRHRPQGAAEATVRARKAVKRDYLAREAHNRALGLAGEEFILAYERGRLIDIGNERLANKVEHVSVNRGDGLGFDILSFDPSGEERFIEVKTTAFGKETPFYITGNELALSSEQAKAFYLYRLFEFRKQPRLFQLQGSIEKHCLLDPTSYLARFS